MPTPTLDPSPLAPLPEVGRRFTGERKVRLGDVGRSGRLRLDALTRYTQDVSDDDTTSVRADPARSDGPRGPGGRVPGGRLAGPATSEQHRAHPHNC